MSQSRSSCYITGYGNFNVILKIMPFRNDNKESKNTDELNEKTLLFVNNAVAIYISYFIK